MSDAPTFDRDATKEALPVVAQALMNGGVQGCDEFAAGAAVLDAARWAVAVTEGDGIWWCERHQCRLGYTPDCGWSPRGEACPRSRRLLIEWDAK